MPIAKVAKDWIGMFAVCARCEEMELVEGYEAAGVATTLSCFYKLAGDRLAEAMARIPAL